MDQIDHRKILVGYRAQLESLDMQIRELMRQRHGIASVVQGLEVLLGEPPARGIPTRRLPGEAKQEQLLGSDILESGTLEMALAALAVAPVRPYGAMEVRRMIRAKIGKSVSYQTLYKALLREANRPHGRIAKNGDAFILKREGGDDEENILI